MRILHDNETVMVTGQELIAGNSLARSARVSSIKNRTWESHDKVGNSSAYGMTLTKATLTAGEQTYHLQPNQYFAVHTPATITSECAFVVEVDTYKCLQQVGGPCETTGRLRYIDGCSDSLIIGPAVVGDPCFNLLHFPKHTDQTMHTHPSLRCGMTIAGEGIARFPDGEVALQTGSVWFLATEGKHAFATRDSELLVTAWHPDTDTGPSHDDHPMLNRTMVDGVSARYIDEIRTDDNSVNGNT